MYPIDRIEGVYAVCEAEDRTMHEILLTDLPFEAKEGITFVFEDGVYTVVENPRKQRVRKLMDKLWK